MVRPHNNWDFSLHHVVCCSHVSSHLGHKQQAGIPFSNKPWRDRNQDPFSHPIEEFQAMVRITLQPSPVFSQNQSLVVPWQSLLHSKDASFDNDRRDQQPRLQITDHKESVLGARDWSRPKTNIRFRFGCSLYGPKFTVTVLEHVWVPASHTLYVKVAWPVVPVESS
jgi:hypothetical protein